MSNKAARVEEKITQEKSYQYDETFDKRRRNYQLKKGKEMRYPNVIRLAIDG